MGFTSAVTWTGDAGACWLIPGGLYLGRVQESACVPICSCGGGCFLAAPASGMATFSAQELLPWAVKEEVALKFPPGCCTAAVTPLPIAENVAIENPLPLGCSAKCCAAAPGSEPVWGSAAMPELLPQLVLAVGWKSEVAGEWTDGWLGRVIAPLEPPPV